MPFAASESAATLTHAPVKSQTSLVAPQSTDSFVYPDPEESQMAGRSPSQADSPGLHVFVAHDAPVESGAQCVPLGQRSLGADAVPSALQSDTAPASAQNLRVGSQTISRQIPRSHARFISEQSVPPATGPDPSSAHWVARVPSQLGAPAVQTSGEHAPRVASQYSDGRHVSMTSNVAPLAPQRLNSSPTQ
jgi:hypothetical protein